MNGWVLVGLGVNLAMLLMAVTWAIGKRIRNAGVVDVAWAYGFAMLTIFYATVGGGASLRSAVFAGMTLLWSLRLGTHVLLRVIARHPQETPRYAALRESFPQRPWLMFFGFFLLQGLLIGILSAPFAIVLSNATPGFGPWEMTGIVVWVIGFAGEIFADAQLARFRKDPANRERVCDTGLWRYSRHPNYFFEWLVWIAFFLFALGSPGGWLALIGPLVMGHFLVNVTGIPPTEAHALATRGEAYREYQRTTSAFLPWWPKTRSS
jgi:steroid 5-alpha reductase family enzyme